MAKGNIYALVAMSQAARLTTQKHNERVKGEVRNVDSKGKEMYKILVKQQI